MASEAGASPFRVVGGGLRVELRVQPGASRDRIGGRAVLGDGAVVLLVRVAAPAEGGRANDALIRLLAKAWGLPRSALSVARGAAARRKSLEVAGDPACLRPRLEAWLAEQERLGTGA